MGKDAPKLLRLAYLALVLRPAVAPTPRAAPKRRPAFKLPSPPVTSPAHHLVAGVELVEKQLGQLG